MSNISDDVTRSYIAFRPSIYATGVQSIAPYTAAWPQGSDYGGQMSEWFYSHLNLDQEGSVGGTCIDHAGIIGTQGSRVSCAALSDAMAGRPPGTTPAHDPNRGAAAASVETAAQAIKDYLTDNEPECDEECERKKKRDAAFKVAGMLLLGITSAVVVKRHFTDKAGG